MLIDVVVSHENSKTSLFPRCCRPVVSHHYGRTRDNDNGYQFKLAEAGPAVTLPAISLCVMIFVVIISVAALIDLCLVFLVAGKFCASLLRRVFLLAVLSLPAPSNFYTREITKILHAGGRDADMGISITGYP
ncbi:TPA: hypothetical protein ACUA7X_004538 [Escherichia coli]|uniref:hypothetical protein n=1 Tax=Escherichia coli TaxID=562 RepID=UPI0015E8F7A2|nr:hypothetical protein [Escherichia coli]QMA66032.1 hypothetical protein HV023_14655 [Escherichia coli]QMG08854.1 hypothetical protein HVY67_14815 [Escherichia coli]QMG37133.1 hypothetical protein HVY61_14820 [Escherichia coli]QMG47456.1 hypothetical protein HVY59_22450 [Escherichia coli]